MLPLLVYDDKSCYVLEKLLEAVLGFLLCYLIKIFPQIIRFQLKEIPFRYFKIAKESRHM